MIIVKCADCGNTKSISPYIYDTRYTKTGRVYRCIKCINRFNSLKLSKSVTQSILGTTKCRCGCGHDTHGQAYIDGHSPANSKYARMMDEYITEHGHPKCLCGCGQNVLFYRGKPNTWAQGHQGIGQKITESISYERSQAAKANWDKNRNKLLSNMKKYKRNSGSGKSILNSALFMILSNLKVKFEPEYRMEGYSYPFDFWLCDYNTIIEVNGDYWHQLPNKIINDKLRAAFLKKEGIMLEVIWEHEFISPSRLLNRIKTIISKASDLPDETIDFNRLTVHKAESTEYMPFLRGYHYLGAPQKSLWCYGLYDGNLMIGAAGFCGITRNESATRLGAKSYEVRELSRFCIANNTKNLASWFLSRVLKLLRHDNNLIKIVITFADETFGHDGTIYKASNWKYDGDVEPTYYYVDSDGNVYHKKTLWNFASKMKMGESDLADQIGAAKIGTSKKHRFIYSY
jgi:very-short-patch-repair endonuclease